MGRSLEVSHKAQTDMFVSAHRSGIQRNKSPWFRSTEDVCFSAADASWEMVHTDNVCFNDADDHDHGRHSHTFMMSAVDGHFHGTLQPKNTKGQSAEE